MKTRSFLLAAGIVLALALTFSCDSGGGGSTGDAITYTGTADGVTYTLEIEDVGSRTALTPAPGDKYTLTQTATSQKSTGTVTKVVGGVLTLAPKEDPDDEFTATVSGNGITAMSGNITWDDGTANTAPNTLTPSGGGDDPSSSSGCEQVGVIQGDPVSYAGETYPTVVIGSQTWFAKDLNYNASGSGYDWATAMALPSSCNSGSSCSSQIQSKHKGVCPSGWHIPSNAEWRVLVDCAGGGNKLKATSGWINSDLYGTTGTDDYGFSALPNNSNGFSSYWWSASDYEYLDGYDYAYLRLMTNIGGSMTEGGGSKSGPRSVRCVQD